jgi:hypothetical protein
MAKPSEADRPSPEEKPALPCPPSGATGGEPKPWRACRLWPALRKKKSNARRGGALAGGSALLCCAAMEIGPLRERVSKLQSRLTVLRGHL